MFTGLIETIGTVLEYTELDTTSSGGNGVSIVVGDCASILVDVHLGDSISTNGVCLTVTEFDEAKTQFKVGVAPETLRRTNLGDLKKGSKVNLERAVTSDVRLGGHVVQGHVDTIAAITKRVPDGNAITFTFQLRDKENIAYIVEKGFIAIDGTSLTVTAVNYETYEFSIMMISYTQGKVTLPSRELGESVNIEVDLTGKLIEKQIEVNLNGQINNEDSVLHKLIVSLVEKKVKELVK
ncbi:riboflavin synthase [Scheffersomyces xylosifermentans]|uniref:riboflavin synthase n=1 Tax=Scheffersomyces xylosifermentans TaxID=1304137 RepID=UPI00315C710C